MNYNHNKKIYKITLKISNNKNLLLIKIFKINYYNLVIWIKWTNKYFRIYLSKINYFFLLKIQIIILLEFPIKLRNTNNYKNNKMN